MHTRKCPAYAQLPDTTLYLRKGRKFTRKHHYKRKAADLEFPEKGISGPEAFLKVREQLVGDNEPQRNLITFVSVKALDKYQNKIMHDLRNVNFIDTEVYPRVKRMEQEMVRMMGNLFRDQNSKHCTGISTIGSSEAIYVGTLLHKFKWEERHNRVAHPKLNAIYSFNTHVNWDKATRWNYIQAKKVLPKANDPSSYIFGAEEVKKRIDKNTVCVICTLATTRTGQNDKVYEINTFLEEYHKKTGIFVPIHIDAAIGGFLAPFLKPSLVWDFRLSHVKSINVSFHKFGGTFAGMGMIVVASDYTLPAKFRFTFNVEKTASSLSDKLTAKETNFLADPHTNPNAKLLGKPLRESSKALTKKEKERGFSSATSKSSPPDKVVRREGAGGGFAGQLDDWYINFSKPSAQIVTAYYLLNRLGFEGYKKRLGDCLKVADFVSDYINGIQSFQAGKRLVFKQINEPYYPEIAFKLEDPTFPLRKILAELEKDDGYSVAAYKMDPTTPDVVFRLVIKPNFEMGDAKKFIRGLEVSVRRNRRRFMRGRRTRKRGKRKRGASRRR